MKKRILSFILVLCMVFTLMPISAFASNAYYINGKYVHWDDFSSSPSECWVYAQSIYQKIWGTSFSSYRGTADDMLRNLSDSEHILTADRLKTYVTAAALGSTIRICNDSCEYGNCYNGADCWGHSQIIVQKDANGFTVLEGGLSASPYCREHYYTWSGYADSSWPGGYKYIKYIKWPGASAYSGGGGSTALTVKKTTECKYYVTIPANYKLLCYAGPTDSNNSTYISAKSESYIIPCTKKCELSDGSVRYFFTSGDEPPKALYFIYTSSMDVETKHNYTVTYTDATCTEQGYRTYTCTCGYSYKTGYYGPVGHDYSETYKSATCTEQGYTRYTCRDCGYSYTSYTSPLGHNYENGVCIRCGADDPSYYSGTCGDNLKWKLDKNGTLTISGTGDMYDYSSIMSDDWHTTAPWGACDELITAVNIENGATSIGSYAFYECANLASVTIPNSVTSIGGEAFYECSSLESVTIPDSVTSVGGGAFKLCSNLTSVMISNSVTNIGNGVFYGCNSLTSVTIPDVVTNIGEYAFYGCNSITSVTIPDGVTSIGVGAFEFCSNLTSVTIPDSATSIGAGAFFGTPWNDSQGDFTVVNGILLSYQGRSEIVVIPSTVTSIGDNSFVCCDTITSVTIPDSVISIGEFAFYKCRSLTSVTIPDSVISIGEYAFNLCNRLTSVTIPNGVKSIGYAAFADCSSLECVKIGDGVSSIAGYAFSNCSSLKNVEIGNSATSIDSYAFWRCSNLTSITIPDSVKTIDAHAFEYCNNLNDLIIGNGVTSIGAYAFSECSNLESVTIPDSVTSIDMAAFVSCTNLTNLKIGDSVSNIGDAAFGGCGDLAEVTIPSSVTSIGTGAFYNCSSMSDVYYSGEQTDWQKIEIGENNDYLLNANIHYNYEPHSHSYTAVVTTPTCTEQGYTTYTCSCGDSYVADYVDPLGHNYVNGKCTRCGADDPDYNPVTNAGKIIVSDARARAGEEVTVSVSIEDNPGVMVMALGIDYDKSKLELIGFEDGIMTGWKVAKNAVWIGADDVTTNGVILKLKFKVLEDVEDGDIQVSLLFSEGDIANHDEEIIMPGMSEGTITVYSPVPGDVTGDGKVNALDLVRLQRYLSGEDVVIGGSCDITGDGKVNALDLVRLQRYLSGEDVAIF